MAEGMSDAWRLLDSKVSVPSEMRTAEWSAVPQWTRERSFYSAGVARADILENFRGEVGAIANGQSSIEQSRKKIEQFLDSIGYQPEAGQVGTIKDLRSMRRIQVMLGTNVRLLQGWAQKERGLKSIRAYPAWELIRLEGRKMPRLWIKRWIAAGGKLYAGRMIAVKDSPVWLELGNGEIDSIGVDYPPFAWGSGMGWRAVPFSECKALGILKGWTPPAPRPLSSPNESLETKPKITDGVMRKALADRMQGLAEWQGDKFVFTDPNGTRKMSAEKLDAVWRRGMPVQFHRETKGGGNDGGLFQREALRMWLEDPQAFEAGGNPDTSPGRLDTYDDLQRLFGRIAPMAGKVLLFRELTVANQAAREALLENLKATMVYQAAAIVPGEAWSTEAGMKAGGHVIRLVCEGHRSAKDLSPLAGKPLVIFMGGIQFRVSRIEGFTVYLEEI